MEWNGNVLIIHCILEGMQRKYLIYLNASSCGIEDIMILNELLSQWEKNIYIFKCQQLWLLYILFYLKYL